MPPARCSTGPISVESLDCRRRSSERPELFITTLSEKLLIFAIGRGVAYYDAPAMRKIVRDASAQDYRFSSIVMGVVNSTPFRMRSAANQ